MSLDQEINLMVDVLHSHSNIPDQEQIYQMMFNDIQKRYNVEKDILYSK